ncbi:MAG: heparan-alpha-glucosaminide N-acetyltransferase domain-containing protein [Vicinamibacterales bacterium]|nr:heparan-alpha-glucosaminide N-acetyltransferase domain-containing protein [Vicinamibacterales bacterium]
MIIMALDHIRDFLHYGAQHFAPEDLTQTTTVLFFTRWITHFCAPVFVFLAGTSSYLAANRGRSASAVSRLLLTRGLWLVVVEMTLVLFGGTFNLSYTVIIWQVIWAIGWSMVALSFLMFLPWRALLAFSVVMIGLHNLLDPIRPEQFSSLAWLWQILHVGLTPIQLSERHVILVIYPLIPWIGVMSAGYCFGRVFDLETDRRRRLLMQTGAALTAGFIALRLLNLYGDPNPWSPQSRIIMTGLSFLNTWKYPPSLDYLLMTLGPSIVALGFLDRVAVGERNPFLVFGRVPFFYYVIHWYVLHLVALAMAWARYGRFDFMFGLPPSVLPMSTGYPQDYGYDLSTVYLVWIAIVAGLYPVCAWFAALKARNRSIWLSYL